MRDLLKKIQIMEQEMEKAEQQSEYWLQEEHFDMEKSDSFEAEADSLYESLYMVFEQAAEKVVSMTSGRIDKVMAMTMIRCRRSEVERLFA